MTDQTIITIVTAIPTTIAAVAAAYMAIQSNARTVEASAKVDQVHENVAHLTTKVDEVHILTNQNFTEQKQTIATLQAKVESLLHEARIAEATRTTLAGEAAHTLSESTSPAIIKP